MEEMLPGVYRMKQKCYIFVSSKIRESGHLAVVSFVPELYIVMSIIYNINAMHSISVYSRSLKWLLSACVNMTSGEECQNCGEKGVKSFRK